ncbi:transcriptional regulator [Laribacter hongkongensis]|uniref:helix-turn-helix domain-containing protein n=1 Tax=Laribacter hongkongensis TaxID=168471 RepID=UPI0018788F69|nr:transcriptional regulator [Laribacter hongkongensis]MBE5527467.1 transcriptional regulator [Laribacter hongkongensis]
MKSTATIRPLFSAIVNPRDIRRQLGLNQQAFWSCIGVTQSGGSRYESGRNMPKPVRELLRLVHVEGVDITAVRGEDVQIIAYLKDRHPDLYKSLRKAVRQQNPSAAGVAG